MSDFATASDLHPALILLILCVLIYVCLFLQFNVGDAVSVPQRAQFSALSLSTQRMV